MSSPLGPLSLLDGGFTSHLIKLTPDHSGIEKSPLWGTECNIRAPEAVTAVYKAYLDAGSTVLTTNTYQASVDLIRQHLPEIRSDPERLFTEAVRLCREVALQGSGVKVAGSVGPYGACLGDGSEYTGAYVGQVSGQDLEAWHEQRLLWLCKAGVDVLAIETIPSKVEAKCILNVLHRLESRFQTPFWVSFQCQSMGAKTGKGEPYSEAVSEVLNHPASKSGRLIAIGANCTDPRAVTDLLTAANRVNKTSVPYVIYPNSGEDWDADKQWNGALKTDLILELIPEWLKLGARMFGGCCQIGPDTIREMRDVLLSSLLHGAVPLTSKEALTPWSSVESMLMKKAVKTMKKRREEEKSELTVRGLEDVVEGMRLAPGLTTAHQIEEVMLAIQGKFVPEK